MVGDRIAAAVFFLLPALTAFANKGTVILLVMLGLAGLWDAVARGRPLPSFPVPRLMAAAFGGLLAWAALSALWAEAPGLAVPRALQMGGLVAAGIAALVMVPFWDDARRRRLGFALSAGLVLLFALMVLDGVLGGAVEGGLRRLTGNAVSSQFNPTRFKIAITISGILLPPLLLWHWREGRRWVVILLPATLAAAGVIAKSNTGMLAAVIGGAVLLLTLLLPRMIAGLTAVLVVGLFLGAPFLIKRLPQPYDLAVAIEAMPNSMMHRLVIWNFTADHVLERPLAGWGFDASREIPGGDKDIPAPVRAFGKVLHVEIQALPLHPHNLMLQVWLEMGLVGVCGFALLVLALIRAALANRPLTAPALGMVAGALVVGAASFGAWQAWWVSAQWLFAFLCIALPRGMSERPAAG